VAWWNLVVKGLMEDGVILYIERTKTFFLGNPEPEE
jgi:hypothetical protein